MQAPQLASIFPGSSTVSCFFPKCQLWVHLMAVGASSLVKPIKASSVKILFYLQSLSALPPSQSSDPSCSPPPISPLMCPLPMLPIYFGASPFPHPHGSIYAKFFKVKTIHLPNFIPAKTFGITSCWVVIEE